MYVYKHQDGRQSGGKSTWEAMRRALGIDEASALLDKADVVPTGDADGNYQAVVDKETGETVGTLRECY